MARRLNISLKFCVTQEVVDNALLPDVAPGSDITPCNKIDKPL